MMTKKQTGYFLLKDFTKSYLILKAQNPLLIQMQNRLNKRLTEIGNRLVERAVDDAYVNPNRYTDRIQGAYRESLTNIFRAGELEVMKTPGVKMTTSLIPDYKLNNIIENRTFRASDYTMKRLTGDVLPKIREGIRQGTGHDITTQALKTEFKGMTEAQLHRISRTETHSVYNQSKFETMLQSQAVKGKQWLSSGLPNMRDWHAEADGQTQYVEDPFIVNGEDLMYPGDPNGSVENIIYCECTMTPVIRESEIEGV
jgi:hypothetical protein